MKNVIVLATSIALSLLLVSCASTDTKVYQPEKSFLEVDKLIEKNDSASKQLGSAQTDESNTQDNFKSLNSFNATKVVSANNDLNLKFSEEKFVQITSDELPVADFIHYIYGDVLGVNYVIGDKLEDIKKTITINIQEKLSLRKLFTLSEQLLADKDIIIAFEDDVFFIHQQNKKAKSGQVAYGYGNSPENVPNTSLEIIQLVPVLYGVQSQLTNVLKTVANVKVTYNSRHNGYILRGKRKEIIRSLEFMGLIDRPNLTARHIGAYQATYTSLEELLVKIPELLKQEGLTTGLNGQTNAAISFVPIESMGTLIMFANTQSIIERAAFWAKELDKPLSGEESQYFIYQPKYSRATDLGDSINALFGNVSSSKKTSVANENNQANQKIQQNRTNRNNKKKSNFHLVVDERANALIFDTTGEQYRKLLPLIKRLDVSPKQVILEMFIAEVTLTDEFKQGVEFALNNGGWNLSTKGAFGVDGFGGLSYLLEGSNANVLINLFQSNSLVNVLSKPSLVVRDGVAASISVGTDIPVVGQTTQDPINGDKQTTQIEYRKTGIDLSVTPTINAQGVVIMTIDQSISNQVDSGSTVADSPSIFERTINTEVVAESGQTVILGGLISENISEIETKVPLLGDMPFIGALFRGETEKTVKTELVIMVTPKIIEKTNEWDDVKAKFAAGLQNLSIN